MISTEKVVARVNSLPTLPTSVAKLMTLVSDERSTAADFERAVRGDLALTANLLRVANSVLYKGTTPATTVTQAIVRLGLTRLLQVAASMAFRRVVPPFLPGYEMPAVTFWLHAMTVAVLSEAIAQRTRAADARMAFTSGLLHDVGKLVIGEFLAEDKTAVREKLETLSMIETEQRCLGTDHCVVGLAVAEKWKLSSESASVNRWHHAPDKAMVHRPLVDIVHVADVLAHSFGLGTDIGELQRRMYPESLKNLKISRVVLDHLVGSCFDEVLTYADVFGEAQQQRGG